MLREQQRGLAALGVTTLTASPAFGHAADQGFVLLLPTTAYITGGTVVVAMTIALLCTLRSGHMTRLFRPVETKIDTTWFTPKTGTPLAASAILALLICVGLMGPTDPQANLLPLTLWTVWWMALFVVQGLVFDIWHWINPWVGVHRLVLPEFTPWLRMPERLSVWPAVLIFAAFQGFVLADVAPNDPRRLASFVLGYWAFTFVGMSVFGRSAWLRQVECFTVLFRIIGLMRLAGGRDTLKVGTPGWQVFQNSHLGMSHAIFVLVLMAAGSFDGLHETFWWLAQLGVNPLEFPGRSALVYATTFGLLGAIAVLIVVFAIVIWLGVVLVRSGPDQTFLTMSNAFIRFSFTLLPIAIGYHFAHYFVTFLVQIQVVVANLADPFARGWNLLGLGSTRVMVGFLTVPQTVKMLWLTQAGVVVASHVLAVFMSHRTAEALCAGRRDVLKIQLGLSVLMVGYTIFGLWLLASPRGA